MEFHVVHSTKPRSVHFVRHICSVFLKVLLHGCAGPQRGRGAPGVAQVSEPADDVCQPAEGVCRPRVSAGRGGKLYYFQQSGKPG